MRAQTAPQQGPGARSRVKSGIALQFVFAGLLYYTEHNAPRRGHTKERTMREASVQLILTVLRSDFDELLVLPPLLAVLRSDRPLCRLLAPIELGDDLGVDTVELLLGEDAQQRPREIERLEDRARLVRACGETRPAIIKKCRQYLFACTLVCAYLVRRTGARTCRGTQARACPPRKAPPHQQQPSSPPHRAQWRIWHTAYIT